MLQYIRKARAQMRGEEGSPATEYVLLLAGIAALIIVAVFLLGSWLNTKFTDTKTSLENCSTSQGQNCS